MNDLINKYKKAPLTMGLISICVIVYMISFVLYGVEMNVYEGLEFGGFNPVYVLFYHEYYRLFTANFIHFGILHVVVNCYSLYGIGMFIERTVKNKNYIIILLVSALASTGLPYLLFLWNGYGAQTVSGGISGVIFGLIGSLGALALAYKNVYLDIFKQLATNVGLMLIISFLVPSISLSGHVCGMIGGFIVTYILLHLPKKKEHQHLVN